MEDLRGQTTVPTITSNVPNFVKVGEAFPIRIWIDPPANKAVHMHPEETSDIRFSPTTFDVKPGEHKRINAVIKRQNGTGIVDIRIIAAGFDDATNLTLTGFTGHLKPSFQGPLPYDSPTTMTVAIVGANGDSLLLPNDGQLQLSSSDAIILGAKQGAPLTLPVPPGSQSSQEFQIRPKNMKGGTVHLNAILTLPDYPMVLTQSDFSFSAEPVWWLPLLLAVSGGLLHGIYNTLRLPAGDIWSRKSFWILLASGVAGVVGYLFANLDILGLKLDPNVLRTYPLLGFLFSYFGFEFLLPERLRPKNRPPNKEGQEEPA
jgi:hypothetical protein